MLHFIYFTKEELLNQQIKSLQGSKELVEFNLEPNNLLSIVNEINSIDIFNTPKTFVLYDATFFQIKSHKFKKKQLPIFIEAVNRAIDDIIIPLTKAIDFKNVNINACPNRNYIDLSDDNAVSNYYINEFITQNNIQIGPGELTLLKNNLDNNFLLIKNELLKLSNFTNFEPITKDVINKLSLRTVESNAFELMELIFKNDNHQASELFRQLINEGSNPVQILGLIATQIRFSYQVKLLSSSQSANDIANILKANPYRVKITLKNLNSVSIHKIAQIYSKCANIDYLIKSGKLDQDLTLDYILN